MLICIKTLISKYKIYLNDNNIHGIELKKKTQILNMQKQFIIVYYLHNK